MSTKVNRYLNQILLVLVLEVTCRVASIGCGSRSRINTALIVFGNDTTARNWPWHAAIFVSLPHTHEEYRCGGSLLGTKTILTAAHCLVSDRSKILLTAESFRVVLAPSSSNYTLNVNDKNAKIHKVKRAYIHEDYDPRSANLHADIGLLELEKEAEITDNVSPICFPFVSSPEDENTFEKYLNPGTTRDVIGFGITESGGLAENLKFTNVPIISRDECNNGLRVLTSNMQYCAGTRNESAVCRGDSGGGMVFQMNGKYYIQGLVSFGEDASVRRKYCKSYAVYTKVYKFSSWVSDILGKTEDKPFRRNSNKTAVEQKTNVNPGSACARRGGLCKLKHDCSRDVVNTLDGNPGCLNAPEGTICCLSLPSLGTTTEGQKIGLNGFLVIGTQGQLRNPIVESWMNQNAHWTLLNNRNTNFNFPLNFSSWRV